MATSLIRADDRGCTIEGPEHQRVRILFGALGTGQVRIKLRDAGPMYIKEAFLPGNGKDVIITVVPGQGGAAHDDETD